MTDVDSEPDECVLDQELMYGSFDDDCDQFHMDDLQEALDSEVINGEVGEQLQGNEDVEGAAQTRPRHASPILEVEPAKCGKLDNPKVSSDDADDDDDSKISGSWDRTEITVRCIQCNQSFATIACLPTKARYCGAECTIMAEIQSPIEEFQMRTKRNQSVDTHVYANRRAKRLGEKVDKMGKSLRVVDTGSSRPPVIIRHSVDDRITFLERMMRWKQSEEMIKSKERNDDSG